MPVRIAEELGRRFGLTPEQQAILDLGPAVMSRRQRRIYHGAIEPRLAEFRAHLAGQLRREGADAPARWATAAAFSIISKGHASICDQLVIDLVGRRAVSAVMDAARGMPREGPPVPAPPERAATSAAGRALRTERRLW
jgi:hypothetical protein